MVEIENAGAFFQRAVLFEVIESEDGEETDTREHYIVAVSGPRLSKATKCAGPWDSSGENADTLRDNIAAEVAGVSPTAGEKVWLRLYVRGGSSPCATARVRGFEDDEDDDLPALRRQGAVEASAISALAGALVHTNVDMRKALQDRERQLAVAYKHGTDTLAELFEARVALAVAEGAGDDARWDRAISMLETMLPTFAAAVAANATPPPPAGEQDPEAPAAEPEREVTAAEAATYYATKLAEVHKLDPSALSLQTLAPLLPILAALPADKRAQLVVLLRGAS